MNIPVLGMSYSDWLLCARLVEDPEVVLVQRKPGAFRQWSVWVIPGPDLLPVQATPWVSTGGRFPYDFEVEPD